MTATAPEPMPGPEVTVYTTGPGCVKCAATKRTLTKAGVEFREILLSDVPEIADEFRAAGHLVAPVVVSPIGTWSDHRERNLAALVEHFSL